MVPLKFRSQILKELHAGHQGMERMKAFARSIVWWPGLDKEIEGLARRCPECVVVQAIPLPVPVHPWVWPTKPWGRVHIDFMGPIFGKTILVVVDSY